MSLLPWAKQVEREEAGYEALLASLGDARPYFEATTAEQSRDAIRCRRHGAMIGEPCGRSPRGPYCCISRHMDAARQAADARP